MKTSSTDPHGLTPRERLFVDGWIAGKRVADAYRSAGYQSKSTASAQASGSKLLAKPKIQAAILAQRTALRESATIDLHETLSFLTQVVRTPIGKIDENSPLMQSYTRTEGELSSTVRYQMVSKLDSLKHLTFLLGYDPAKKQEHSADTDLKALLLFLRSGTP